MRGYSPAFVLAGLCLLATCIITCKGASTGPDAGIIQGSGAYIGSESELQPTGNPGPTAKMILAGMIIPVDLKTVSKGNEFDIELWYKGELFEKEQYQDAPDGFDLVNAAGETYNPPIPLLHFPMHVGDQWKWSGNMLTGPAGRKATAVVRTQNDKVDMGGQTDALLVEVDLSMYSGASEPAARRLAFWFVKDKGLVRREFGSSTSRLPGTASAGY